MHDVWYVPAISRNLFSILAAHDRNPGSKFKSDLKHCEFSVNGETIFTGTRDQYGTLYRASFHTIQPQEVCANIVENSQLLQLYHERWGHMDK